MKYLLLSLALPLLLVPGAGAAARDTAGKVVAGIALPAPLPPKPVTDTYFGDTVVDPYRYLEDAANDPDVQQWMRAQADATSAILARIPGRDPLLARIREIDAAAPGAVGRIKRTSDGRLFFMRRNPDENQSKLVLREPGGGERVLVDPEALGSKAGRSQAVLDFEPSPDGRLLAYSLQAGGGEIGELHVIDVASGRALAKPIDRIRFAGVCWQDDGRGFFYGRLREGWDKLPPEERFGDRTTHYFQLSDPADPAASRDGSDRPVFSPLRNAALKLPIFAGAAICPVPGTNLAAAVVYLGVDRDRLLYLADLDAAARGTAEWRQVVRKEDRVAEVDIAAGWIYLRTSAGAPRFRVLRMPLAQPDIARAEVIVPAGSEVVTGLGAARDALYVTRRDGLGFTLTRIPHDASKDAQPVALPFAGTVGIAAADARQDGVLLTLAAWTRATQRFTFDPAAGGDARLRRLQLAREGAFDSPPGIEARELRFRSHDGVEVPMSIIARKDIRLDGRNPTILYGYGAYGLTEDPFFNPRLIAWIERGGVYAYAHVRGGGVFGEEWHRAGQKTTKPNTWRDGIAAAQWLVKNGYTAPSRIGILGGSAGGIFVGRAITEAPARFAAAVAVVPVMDMLRSETRANGVANIPEYGTVRREDEYRALRAMSTFHHVRDGVAYPALMLVHGVNDTRVDVWQSAKLAARMQYAQQQGGPGNQAPGGGGPVLMRLDYDLGHGGGSTRAQQQTQTADIWSFFLWQFGEPGFQPAAAAGKAAAKK